ncbi:MAG: hypothetical protein ACK5O7_01910 [Holosporales bacterium]
MAFRFLCVALVGCQVALATDSPIQEAPPSPSAFIRRATRVIATPHAEDGSGALSLRCPVHREFQEELQYWFGQKIGAQVTNPKLQKMVDKIISLASSPQVMAVKGYDRQKVWSAFDLLTQEVEHLENTPTLDDVSFVKLYTGALTKFINALSDVLLDHPIEVNQLKQSIEKLALDSQPQKLEYYWSKQNVVKGTQ